MRVIGTGVHAATSRSSAVKSVGLDLLAQRSGSQSPSSTSPAKAWSSMSRASIRRQAARLQIEQRLFVELADRRAVGALHVVGEDLELRVRVDLRVVGQQQRAVGLLRVGLLRVVPDDDPAVEHRLRLAGEDALVELVAGAVRHRVIDRGVVVDQLLAVGEIHAVHRAVGAFALQRNADVVTLDPRAGRERVRFEHALGRDVGLDVGEVERAFRFTLIRIQRDVRAVADHHFRDRVVEVLRTRSPDERLRHADLAVGACHDQHARVRGHGLAVAAGHDHDVDGRFDHGTGGHEDRHAVIEQRGVERRKRMRVEAEHLAEVLLR